MALGQYGDSNGHVSLTSDSKSYVGLVLGNLRRNL